MYSCSNSTECLAKKWSSNQLKNEEIFIPLRLMVCAHSVCELCVLHSCQQNASFIKCSICGFNTTITETVSRNVIQYETDIKKWLDSSGSVGQVLRMDMNLFPLDFHSIASGVDSGVMTATKTPLTLELDLDEDIVNNALTLNNSNNCNNYLTEDDMTVSGIPSKVSNTLNKKFHEIVCKGVKTFTDLSTNHTSIRRTSDETKDWFKKLRNNTKETFHKMHSILQLREKELLDEIDSSEETRLQDLRVFMNEILSKRSELKGKLLHCSQSQTDVEKRKLRKAIEQLVKDSNVLNLNSPQKEFKLLFDSTIESQLKTYGTIERNIDSVQEEVKMNTEEDMEDLGRESPISVSSDEEDMSYVSAEGDENSRQMLNREIVTVLQMKSPYSFYVQKASDKERFEYLKSQIIQICSSAYYHAPAGETLAAGEKLFAYSLKNKCWCRATLIHYAEVENEENEFFAEVFLIDYGITETVKWYNIREKKLELFDEKKWPPFAYKCALFNIKPFNRKISSRDWSSDSLDLFRRYVHNNQLVMFVFETKDGINFVDLYHYDVPEVTYQMPSLIEIFVNNEYAILNANIDFSSYSRYNKCQPLKYPDREMPKTLKTVSVLVSHVESPDLFYVQLQRQHNILLKLIDELNQTYNEENKGIYTYYCPKVNTPCAALFDGDKRFYRALVVQKAKSLNESIVQFVDFGNKQTVKNSDLRLIKDSMIQKLPIQSISCYLIHVEPAFGFKWSQHATDYFKFSISNDRGPQILTMCVYEVKQQKLGVLLRSYDGDTGVKVNEVLVKQKFAVSSGPLSLPDNERERMTSSQESLNSVNSNQSSRNIVQTPVTMPYKVSAFIVLKEMFERSKEAKADKKSSLIKVSVSAAKDPSQFYVRIDKPEVKNYFKEMEKLLHEEYSSRYRHLGDTNFKIEDFCALKVDGDWRRGQVIKRLNDMSIVEPPQEPKFKVLDIDYGVEHDLNVSQMRRLSDQFLKDGSFAVKCRLAFLQPTGGSVWAHSAKDELNNTIKKFKDDLYILVKQNEIIEEPISVKLYARETIIPGAFEKLKTTYHSLNQILIDKGFAIFDRNESAISGSDCATDDDNEINEETHRESRTEMPFSLFSQSNGTVSVLESLHLREQQTNDSNTQLGKFFKYLDEVYPTGERIFWAIATGIHTSDKIFNISFRHWKGGENTLQPLQQIESKISAAIHSKGELEPFRGPFTKDNACTAYFDWDKSWNRAEIVGISRKSSEDHSQLIVRFVDYGQTDSILVDKLSSELFGIDVPKLALKCELFNIKPINEESVEAISNEIYAKILDKKCKFIWENYSELPMKVSIEVPHQNSYVSFRSVLLEKNLILNEENDENVNQNKVENIMNYEKLVRESYGVYPVKFNSSKFYSVIICFYLVDNYAFFQANEIRQPQQEECVINDEHDEFIWMLDDMRNNIDSNQSLRNMSRGTPCCAQFTDDDLWYRGLVIDVDFDAQNAQIFFIDYGNTDTVPFKRIREIHKKHMKPSAHTFFCQFYNVRPRDNYLWSKRKDITNAMVEHLSDICDAGRLFAKFRNCQSFPYEIDLYIADEEDRGKPGKHALQEFVNDGRLEFVEPKEVWRKPIQETPYFRNKLIKSEPIN